MRGGAAGPPRAELPKHAAWEEADTCSPMSTVLLAIPLSAFLCPLPSQSNGQRPHPEAWGAGEHRKCFQNRFQLRFPLIETFQRLVNSLLLFFFPSPGPEIKYNPCSLSV